MEEAKQLSQRTMEVIPLTTGSTFPGGATPVSRETTTSVVTPPTHNKPENSTPPNEGLRPSRQKSKSYAPMLQNIPYGRCPEPPSHFPGSNLPLTMQAQYRREAMNRLQPPFRNHYTDNLGQHSMQQDPHFRSAEPAIASSTGRRFRRSQQNVEEALMLETMIAFRQEMETRIALARLSSLPTVPRLDLPCRDGLDFLHSAASFPRNFPNSTPAASTPPHVVSPMQPTRNSFQADLERTETIERNRSRRAFQQRTPTTSSPAPQHAQTPSPSSSTERVYVDTVQLFDILCGRGGKSNHHVGNKKYRHVVAYMKRRYQHCPGKSQKTDLSRQIVEYCTSYGARFLKKEADSDKYYVLTKDEARRKTSQALREPKELKWTST